MAGHGSCGGVMNEQRLENKSTASELSVALTIFALSGTSGGDGSLLFSVPVCAFITLRNALLP